MESAEEKIARLKEKYELLGQDWTAYLEGLLVSNPLTYWDYIHVDTLLTLQNPKTAFPDELIFIIYHQVTELYFRLSIHQLEQLAHNGRNVKENGQDMGWNEKLNVDFFIESVRRVNTYFEALTKSFEIMIQGMEKEQFLKFRMALLPSSGFQSAQYRMIEIMCTPLHNILDKEHRDDFSGFVTDSTIEKMFDFLYWKKGAIELETGKKTLTLKMFEEKYTDKLLAHAKYYKDKNVWEKYLSLSEEDKQNPQLIKQLKMLDANVNINWPLVHYKTAVRYLQKEKGEIAATGGTNWQEYLPPKFQKRIFFPDLWTAQEKEEWGKKWVEENLL
ncbi:MAG: tryptophan 2,3-dioxygenase [Bacteroidetes bacterium]|nr:MAG: tryptophan 2,3-dioxygenase [Bacteroidota bacterium]